MVRKRLAVLLGVLLTAAAMSVLLVQVAGARGRHGASREARTTADPAPLATPIRHLVVIFQENVSFDHYFATYPDATNPPGEPPFHARSGTPTVSGLTEALLTHNPNSSNPQRLDRSLPVTCDQNHGYTAEQNAFDHGLLDMFIPDTDVESCSPPENSVNGLVMDYYDGNTVTGLWNYAQHFAMSDNSYSDTFGPSTPGALNVTSGNTYGVICGPAVTSPAVWPPATPPCASTPGTTTTPQSTTATGTDYSDADPNYDVCSASQDHKSAAQTIQMGGQNVGDLLSSAGITWGWFQGGFASPNYVSGDPTSDQLDTTQSGAICTGSHTNVAGGSSMDYSPHHEPFQYFASTANPDHKPPTSIAMIGHGDQANHQYDLRDFWAAADHGNLPAVSYLKAAEYQDGHAGYSDPLDEQRFLVSTINHLEQLPTWHSTAVVILYDDSDGWYDHQMGPVLTQSQTSLDTLSGASQCGADASKVPTSDLGAPEQARCGLGMRQPLLVISPFSRSNFVDHSLTSQSSVVRFIEDNWLGGQRLGNGSNDTIAGSLANMLDFAHPNDGHLYLDPGTGEPQGGS